MQVSIRARQPHRTDSVGDDASDCREDCDAFKVTHCIFGFFLFYLFIFFVESVALCCFQTLVEKHRLSIVCFDGLLYIILYATA